MGLRLRLWWKQIKKYQLTILFVAIILILSIALIIVEIILYGTGFVGKTLWDWLQLLSVLAVPVVVGFGAVWFTTRQGKVIDAENKDNQRETALQAYIDKMSELLLHEKLRESQPEDEVRKIARVRTLTILPSLDAKRKASVLLFLYESGLIKKDKAIINVWRANFAGASLGNTNLSDANLIEANFSAADLSWACLEGADLTRADFLVSDLSLANLSGAILRRSVLRGADLSSANLSNADLKGASVTTEQLGKAKSLKGAIMPDGSIHP